MKFQFSRASKNSKSGSGPSNKKQNKGTLEQSESPEMNSEQQKKKDKKTRQQKISQDEPTQVTPKQSKIKKEKITLDVSNKKPKKEPVKVKQAKASELPNENLKSKDKKKKSKSAELPEEDSTETPISQVKKKKTGKKRKSDADINEETKSAELPQEESTETPISQVKKKETGKKRKSDADINEEIKPKAKKKKKSNNAANTEVTVADSKDSKPATSKSAVKKFKKPLRLPGEIYQERMTRTVFIGNLPMGFNKKKLLKLLAEYGTVERMWTRGYVPESEDISIKMALKNRLLKEKHPTLVGFAAFKSPAEAETAIRELNGQIFEDHHLRVTLTTEKTQNVNSGVFVGNLPFDVTDEDFRSVFQDCGEILNVRIIRDKKTGRGKGFGYVNFKSADAVELALQLDGDKFRGREIRIKRLLSEGKQKKIKRKKEQKNVAASPKKSFNKNQKKSGFSKGSPKDKQVNKKKKPTKTDIKKKILAKKLITKSKTKE